MKWKDEIVEEVRTAGDFEDLKNKEEQDLAPRANLKRLKPHERRT